MNPPLDEGLFEIFSSSFYGFGRYRATLWFVGPHVDFLTGDEAEAARRLELWHRRGQPPMVDLPHMYAVVGDGRWFGEGAHLHRIWSKLARTALAFEGRRPDQHVRAYQTSELGRSSGDNALLHLMPADTRSDSTWPLESSGTPHLRRPELYVERFTESRAQHISRLTRRHRPGMVVFYDLTHEPWWVRIAGESFQRTDIRNCYVTRTGATTFLMIRHPESIGTRNEYFEHVGALAAHLIADPDLESLPPP